MKRMLIFWNSLILLLLFLIVGVVIRQSVRVGMFGAVDRELKLRVDQFLMHPPAPAPGEHPATATPAPGKGNPFKPHRFDLSGLSVVPPGRYPLWDETAFRECLQSGRGVTSTVMRDGEPLRVLSVPVASAGKLAGVVQVPYPVADLERTGIVLDRTLLALLPVVLILAWCAAFFVTGRALLPVREMTAIAARLSASNLGERLPAQAERRGDELAVLADTFNGMLERLEAAFERQQRFTADASHELKTPLTRIKGLASMALIGPPTEARLLSALSSIDTASDSMSGLVQDLLYLARSDAGRTDLKRETILAKGLLEKALELVNRVAESAPIVVDIQPSGLTLCGNETALLRLIVNLLENALRYTPEDGRIYVLAMPGYIRVEDSGCGIAPEHLARLGERFYRADGARTRHDGGTGLGLAICRSIAEAHGGCLTIHSSSGQGTAVTLLFREQRMESPGSAALRVYPSPMIGQAHDIHKTPQSAP